MTEFWRRWHLTLSGFLKDYIFIPIAKTGWVTAAIASFITMALSGLWHGASFSFILFGAYFGVFMVIEKRFGFTTGIDSPYNFLRNFLAVSMVVMSMPLFLTGNLSHSVDIYAGAMGLNGLGSVDPMLIATSKMTLAFLVLAMVWVVITGVINRRFYALKQEVYVMSHISSFR